jgi:uncharacterized MAPEG superfamily protein
MAMAYHAALCGWLALGLVMVVQFIVADVAGMRAKHVPGMPIVGGHDDFFFRAARALGNTNESLPLFVLLSLAAILAGGSPDWTGYGVWLFVIARALYMVCYYANWRTARSTMFVVGQVAMIGLLVVAGRALLQ